ncbi:ArsR family transcriptional regulator [Cellulosimicrobium cellulans J34]|uniref:ArsR/SmtB family transcription factor n=1 Tax=Cellulosimicrobium sp. SH8 TaxID=2952936 RepID=UPI000464495F|nr:metalloregulator ArsR/SmtB family transcription factor [Cellulosimicrobium sp. SH8]TWG82828.1 ArsR family transcriptional regulator [Cellulosimicrobium cellulans J34]SMF13544.1 transcriptional regulator, ArsR family [Cellulosimicrobium cellulans J1]
MTTTDLPLAPTADVAGCCGPAVTQAVDPDTARDLARAFKALADPTRVQLLAIVASQSGGEACVCDLTEPVGLSQPTVSHHLKILVDAGLLTREQRGRWAYYSLVPSALTQLGAALAETTSS